VIRIELAGVAELMSLYQAVMAAKFSSDGTLLSSSSLASAANTLVDQILSEARRDGNLPMAEAMLDWRELKSEYPQCKVIDAHLMELDWWLDADRNRRLSYLKTLVSPLEISPAFMESEWMAKWLGAGA
jgi:FMN phosphatase YigB (HAD superfamily)